MNRRTMVILGSCLLAGVLLVITLYAATYRSSHERNSFVREYKSSTVVKTGEMDIKFNSWYLAGITKDDIYLGNIKAPFRMLIANNTLTDSQQVRISIKNVKHPTVYPGTIVKIDSPYFYVADGHKPALFRGEIGNWEAEPFTYDKRAYFNQLLPLGNTSFAIRAHENQTFDYILGKVQSDTPSLQLKRGLLQKQVDGMFCTDGTLVYNRDLKRLVYTYYYRNEYIVYDTNLNLDYRGHTIDTFSRAQINVGYVGSDKTKKLMDKKYINILTCTSGNYLFVRSNLQAKNDSEDRMAQESIIDVYDLRDNSYCFSFTLPNYAEKRVRDFMVFNTKTLVALYDHYIIKYDLDGLQFFVGTGQKFNEKTIAQKDLLTSNPAARR